MNIYQRILVPLDFSDDSICALDMALAEFARPGRLLVLLHVMEDSGEPNSNALSRERMQAVSRADITAPAPAPAVDPGELRLRQLQSLAAPHAGAWGQVQTLVKTGDATEAIIEAVAAESIDLVIMGSHGTGGLGRMLFGSTTYAVARKVGCSVMINKRT